jgi:uncharacterized membrane protein
MAVMNDIEKMELAIAKFLRIGVIIAGLVIAIGWLLTLKVAANPFIDLQQYSELPLIQSLKMQFLLQNWGMIISYLGLALLISLPVLRVLLSAFLLIMQKEYLLAIIAGIVIIGLMISFGLGISH